ncbi:hypothetical protein CCR95_03530 [Thiocystis minor]|nr:hypothetical protein [Thiocystis minor]
METRQFAVHLQPKVSLRDGTIVSAEALLRWNHPTRGLASPASFIPLAEESGLIVPLGAWVLRTVCAQQADWQKKSLRTVPVGVNLSAVQFRESRGLFPFHAVKIDRAFIVDIVHNPEDAAIASAIITMARRLGLTVVAEGVETVDQLDYLRAAGCDEMQGYLFSQAVPLETFAAMLRRESVWPCQPRATAIDGSVGRRCNQTDGVDQNRSSATIVSGSLSQCGSPKFGASRTRCQLGCLATNASRCSKVMYGS